MNWDLLRPSRLLNSIPEVLAVYAGAYATCVVVVKVSEAWSVPDALWFGLVTITTTGYGDLSPHSVTGRVAAAALMVVSWLLNILLAGQVAAKLIVNSDAWTNDEQEEVKRLLREIRARVEP
ncbi:MAG: two pore domain potassium channel family protein [Phenylobacterium sp.]|uniref:potassium channel family protein n=1 Tax=Phenylobacterium sp. TaxID=1871053 RepID=UPI001A592E4F|nr:potassium channel family protein [Phenylobacterium sp.]MBL8554670.1 two pore domain potassium channel family protein [Phenylobacterium sp.]